MIMLRKIRINSNCSINYSNLNELDDWLKISVLYDDGTIKDIGFYNTNSVYKTQVIFNENYISQYILWESGNITIDYVYDVNKRLMLDGTEDNFKTAFPEKKYDKDFAFLFKKHLKLKKLL